MKCEKCGKEHNGSYGSGRFCSKSCAKSFSVKNHKNNPNVQKHLNDVHISNRASYGRWKCNVCKTIFNTRYELKMHYHKTNHCIVTSLKHINDSIYQFECIYCHKKFKTAKLGGGHVVNCLNHPNRQTYIESHKQSGKTLSKHIKDGLVIPPFVGKTFSEETKKNMRIRTCQYLMTTYPHPCRYNKRAISFFDQLSKEKGWNLQHAENGGEFYTGIGYFVDAYDKTRNIVVEYDEPRHYEDVKNNVLKQKDIERQQEIINYLHCEFWRYNEKMDVLWKVI